MEPFKAETVVPREIVVNLLSSAIESGRTFGCGYWCYADEDKSVRPPKVDVRMCGDTYPEETWFVHWPLFEGGAVAFVEHDDESVEPEICNTEF